MIVVVIMVAAGIRLIYELLAPVAPYLLAVTVVVVIVRAVRWWQGRW